jgi:hypothetical protein
VFGRVDFSGPFDCFGRRCIFSRFLTIYTGHNPSSENKNGAFPSARYDVYAHTNAEQGRIPLAINTARSRTELKRKRKKLEEKKGEEENEKS